MNRLKLFNVLVVLVVLVACVVGVGFYRGWFALASHGGGDDNKVEIHLTVDSDKARDDAKAVEAKARELTGSEEEETRSDASEAEVKRNDG